MSDRPSRASITLVILLSAAGCRRPTAAGPAAVPSSSREPSRPSASPASAAVGLLPEEAWARRDDPAQLRAAIAAWERERAQRGADPTLYTRLARAYCTLAEVHLVEAGPNAIAETHATGIRAAEEALFATAPELAAWIQAGEAFETALDALPAAALEAAYWYAANLAGYTLAKGLTATLHHGERIVTVLAHVVARDEMLFDAAPHRTLATYLARAPAVAGGDLAKAKHHFERALALAPASLRTKVAFAESYATSAHEPELFRRLLEEVASVPAADLTVEGRLALQRARRLLTQISALF